MAEGRPLSAWKTLLFSAVLVGGFFLALEGLLALVGERPLTSEIDPYVGFVPHLPLFNKKVDDDGIARYTTAPNKRRFFNEQSFLAEKPDGGYRIFCLGGSTTYGRPFDDRTSFCGWLRAFLETAAPGRTFEVINAGGISYASYRVAALLEELSEYTPDLFIIYTGHNEFLERRTYRTFFDRPAIVNTLDSRLSATRSYSVLKRALSPRSRHSGELDEEVTTLLDRSIGPDAYTRDDQLQQHVTAHFDFNLRRMLVTAKRSGARSVLVTPASNLRDCSPFKSESTETITPQGRHDIETDVLAAEKNSVAGDITSALSLLQESVERDPRNAELHFRLGRLLERAGRPDAARTAYREARDQDVCPLRALSPLVATVREVARDRDVPLVDFEALVETAAAERGAAPGHDLFLDHVHPTVDTHRLLALELFQTLNRHDLLPDSIELNDSVLAEADGAVRSTMDRETQALALKNLAKVMSWAGKSSEAAHSAEQALALGGDDAEVLFILGSVATEEAQWSEAEAFYARALRLEPDYVKALNNFGLVLARQGRFEEARDQYLQALRLQPDHANAHFNLGNAYRRLDSLNEAAAHFRRALELDAEDTDAWFNYAATQAERGEGAAAVAAYEELLARAPDDAEAHYRIGKLLAEMGERARGTKHLRTAVTLAPDWRAPAEALAELVF